MYNGGAGSAAPTHSPAPVDAFDADEHDEFEWFRAGITLCGIYIITGNCEYDNSGRIREIPENQSQNGHCKMFKCADELQGKSRASLTSFDFSRAI